MDEPAPEPGEGETREAFVAWSGGKDACWALQEARQAGWDPVALVTMLDEAGERGRSHHLRLPVLQAQAEALGLELVTRGTTREAYEEDFREVLAEMRGRGISAGVFGDVDLDAHREWNGQICGDEGLRALHPLFGRSTDAVARGVLASGLRSRVVVARKDALDRTILGQPYDEGLLDALDPGVDPLGEEGEFHTVVVDAPGFASAVELETVGVREETDRWVLDVRPV